MSDLTKDKILKFREALKKDDVRDVNLRCEHLWNGDTQDESPLTLYGVKLCFLCATDVINEMNGSIWIEGKGN